MFQSPTVFVVGAGASADLGLPLGNTLRDRIADLLEPVGSGYLTGHQSQIVAQASHIRASALGLFDGGESHRQAAAHIAARIGLVRSIDEFIDHHQGEPEIEFMAKLAIAWLIVEAERHSHLILDFDSAEPRLNLARMGEEDAWLLELWNLMRTGSRVTEPEAIFDNVAFIVFNYDRCLEEFLARALIELFRMKVSEARALVAKATIIHPYGQVGTLGSDGIGFGNIAHVGAPQLIELAQGIRTFGESERDIRQMRRIRGLIEDAANLVFLGFAFHDQNMGFFECDRFGSMPAIYSTAFKLPREHQLDIQRALADAIAPTNATATEGWSAAFRECRGAELLRIFDKPLRR